jgi:hypothetical protein
MVRPNWRGVGGAAFVLLALLFGVTGCSDSKDAPRLALPSEVCEVAKATTSTNGNPSFETVYLIWDWCDGSAAEGDLNTAVERAFADAGLERTGNTALLGLAGTEFEGRDAWGVVLPARSFLAAEFGGIGLPDVQQELREKGPTPSDTAVVLMVEAQ